MDGGAFFLIVLDLASDVAVINLKLPLQLFAVALFVEVAVLVHPIFSFEEQIADHHAAEMGDARDAGLRSADGREKGHGAHDEHQPFDL